jgi:asparagine synthase (glutamine-hydrolysing)
MCGLFFGHSRTGLDVASVRDTLHDLRHRGPDFSASLFRNNKRLFFGHTRLNVLDISAESNQPFISECGRWILIFNGEIYNFKELRAQIGGNWPWRTTGDTEVLMAAWSRWGQNCLHRLVGMFAFVIYDSSHNELFIVRDRFGIKPLYYTQVGDDEFFSSEIKPLLRFQQALPDESSIRTYLQAGIYDHSQHTFFKNISSLKPGTFIHIDLKNGNRVEKRWYNVIEEIKDLGTQSKLELEEELDRLVQQAITSHLTSDVRVGLNISGGVDSSMLVSVAQGQLDNLHLFNQDYEGYDESEWIKQIYRHGHLHIERLSFDDINSCLESTVRSQAEPFGGVMVCGYNALYESAIANNVTVLLDGNGVDEVFLGYERYHSSYVFAAKDTRERSARARAFEKHWGHFPLKPLEGSIDGTRGVRPSLLGNKLKDIPVIQTPEFTDTSIDPIRQMALKDLLFSKIPRGLRFNDRVSMSHSRELRVPFLDHRLVEFGLGIPSSYLITESGGKTLFRDVLARREPNSVAYAHKRSVQSPQSEWIGKEWKNFVTNVINSDRFCERGWVNPDAAKGAYSDYLVGDQSNSFFIWQWINLELWASIFIDNEPHAFQDFF